MSKISTLIFDGLCEIIEIGIIIIYYILSLGLVGSVLIER